MSPASAPGSPTPSEPPRCVAGGTSKRGLSRSRASGMCSELYVPRCDEVVQVDTESKGSQFIYDLVYFSFLQIVFLPLPPPCSPFPPFLMPPAPPHTHSPSFPLLSLCNTKVQGGQYPCHFGVLQGEGESAFGLPHSSVPHFCRVMGKLTSSPKWQPRRRDW